MTTAGERIIAPASADPVGPMRWWVYQRERFPLVAHAPLIAAFSFCAVSLSVMLRGGESIALASLLVAFITCLLFFLQLRIADEFKDFEEDARWQPLRAVPRGLVTLRELGWVFFGAAAVQLALAVWLEPRLVILLAIAWLYLAAMTREFGVREYLKARPLLYLVSHMLIMPLVDLYATGTDWLRAGEWLPPGLTWFLAASFFNGMSVEFGRKIRSPEDERVGVPTYSALWGRGRAVTAWWGAIAASMLCALGAAWHLSFVAPLAIGYSLFLVACVWCGAQFLRRSHRGAGKRLEVLTFVWTLGLYLGLGIGPLVARNW